MVMQEYDVYLTSPAIISDIPPFEKEIVKTCKSKQKSVIQQGYVKRMQKMTPNMRDIPN